LGLEQAGDFVRDYAVGWIVDTQREPAKQRDILAGQTALAVAQHAAQIRFYPGGQPILEHADEVLHRAVGRKEPIGCGLYRAHGVGSYLRKGKIKAWHVAIRFGEKRLDVGWGNDPYDGRQPSAQFGEAGVVRLAGEKAQKIERLVD
jgi:hypothetical protein